MTRFNQLLKSGEQIPTFAVARVLHPVVIELFGLAGGYKGFWIDQEHASHNSDQLITITLAGRANGFDSFVRMPPSGYAQVTQCLESGAGGVMAAQIHSAEEARQFMQWAKFPPTGTRGLNAGGRDCDYTHKPIPQFVEDANRDTFVAIQIETIGALEQADDIAAIDGVDLLFIGPSDLSMALGVVGQFHSEKLWEAIGRVADACRNHGKAWGAVTPDPKFASRAVEQGCRMPTMGNDVHILRRGIQQFRETFAAQF